MFFYDLFFIVINIFRTNERGQNFVFILFLINSILSVSLFLFHWLNDAIELNYLFSGIVCFLLSCTYFLGLMNLFALIFGIYLLIPYSLDLITTVPEFSNFNDILQAEKQDRDLFFLTIFEVIIGIFAISLSLYSTIESQFQKN